MPLSTGVTNFLAWIITGSSLRVGAQFLSQTLYRGKEQKRLYTNKIVYGVRSGTVTQGELHIFDVQY